MAIYFSTQPGRAGMILILTVVNCILKSNANQRKQCWLTALILLMQWHARKIEGTHKRTKKERYAQLLIHGLIQLFFFFFKPIQKSELHMFFHKLNSHCDSHLNSVAHAWTTSFQKSRKWQWDCPTHWSRKTRRWKKGSNEMCPIIVLNRCLGLSEWILELHHLTF